MKLIEYNRQYALNYAKLWATKRNTKYYDFSKIGGDCTNFASQCLYSGVNVMNYTPFTGWYYNSPNDRAPAWTSVEYFYKFITTNKEIGPYGKEVTISKILPADFIQLKIGKNFHHTLIITKIDNNQIYVSAHSNDVYDKPLSEYFYNSIRFIHIIGARTY